METKGIEALKKIATELDAAIELGIKIGKDGVGKDDLVYVPVVIERVKALVALIPELKDAEEELKALDLSRGIELAIHVAKEIQD